SIPWWRSRSAPTWTTWTWTATAAPSRSRSPPFWTVKAILMSSTDPLELFLPPVRQWFRSALGAPTPPQRQGWPLIAAGQNTLILAPTGSGKTLAAFLACLDHLWRRPELPRGVRVLYVSPLKALNNDIYRNLQVPLAGVAAAARDLGQELPPI